MIAFSGNKQIKGIVFLNCADTSCLIMACYSNRIGLWMGRGVSSVHI